MFRQGERGELIYHVESGLLEVYRELADGGTEMLARVEPGNYVGELGPILNLPRSASVRALEDSVVVGYTVRAFRQDNPHQAVEANHCGVSQPGRCFPPRSSVAPTRRRHHPA